jgi:asparagine synthase (glutamine-hydrolysing)
MCGLNGIFAYGGSADPPKEKELLATRDHMRARGPDAYAQWWTEDRRLGLGHRRLAILDLSDRADQPMFSDDRRYTVVFNGEIYNHRALRRELEQTGRRFRTTSDTEVLLHLFAVDGAAMTSRLRGMYAFAIWDNLDRRLFLARDPYGIKPLYYSDDGKVFRFASQVKALRAGGAVSGDPEPAGHAGFYLWGSVPEPFTLYKSIRQLPAGTSVFVDERGMTSKRHFHSIAAVHAAASTRAVEPARAEIANDEIRAALLDSVGHHLVADVPVGAFLSAGIDSGSLVGLMRDAGQVDIDTVTLTFEEFQGQEENEGPLAATIAEIYGTRHSAHVVTRREFKEDLPRILEAMDQPSIDGVNTWFVSKAARERGLKVAISGLGGDELFGGYPSFRDVPRWASRFSIAARLPPLGAAVRKLIQVAGGERILGSAKAAGMLEYGGTYAGAYMLRRALFMPWELKVLMGRELARQGLDALRPIQRVNSELEPEPGSSYGKIAVLESTLYMRNQLLRDTDWAGMAHGLEVRVPLVDVELLRRLAPLLNRAHQFGKTALATAPAVSLPYEVVARRKTGFGVPMGDWLPSAAHASRRKRDRWKTSKGFVSRDWSRAVMAACAQ